MIKIQQPKHINEIIELKRLQFPLDRVWKCVPAQIGGKRFAKYACPCDESKPIILDKVSVGSCLYVVGQCSRCQVIYWLDL